ncbi:stalk domain-containing protein [Gorillibacterium timonense]|uniref:stalk domain-containing protein n=1 Tax=Gorillibacterium timonense TaxID=1689269 RepID=UPI00071DBF94|nr:stalk domain-containing protein [Gorillibacterium timonense]
MKVIQPQPNRQSVKRFAPTKWISVPLAVSLLAGGSLSIIPTSALTAHAASTYSGEETQAAANAILPKTLTMKINGQVQSVPGAVSKNGDTTYVALRFLSDKLGLKVSWDPATKSSTVSGRNVTIVTKESDPRPYTINGQKIYGTSPVIRNGTTYIPLRFFLETLGYNVDYNANKQITITALPINALTITTKTINETTSKQEFEIQYPQLTGLADKAVQDKINSFLKTEVEKMAAEARKDLKESEPGAAPNSFTVNYFIKSNVHDKLSLYLESYLYLGGAHGSPARIPFTFDLKTGKVLTLQEAALGNPNYKTIINKEIKKRFANQDYLLTPFESIKDNQSFYLQNDAIVVFFDPYEYTPYAAGFPEFTLPLRLFR